MMKYDNININIITHVDNMLEDEIFRYIYSDINFIIILLCI